MPNPTTAKPTTAELVASDPNFAVGSVYASLPLVEGAGPPREVVSNTISNPYWGYNGLGVYRPPQWQPTGFNGGPTLRFTWNSNIYVVIGRGWTGPPSVRSYLCVFKHNHDPVRSGGNSYSVGVMASNYAYSPGGIGLSVASTGVTLNCTRNQGTVSAGLANLTKGNWYAAGLTMDDSGATKTRTFYLYDYGAQTLVANGTVVNDGTSNPLVDGNNGFILGGFHSGVGSTSLPNFVGEVYDATLYQAALTPAMFAAYYADPSLLVRGSYTGGGALTASRAALAEANKTTVYLGCARPSGGTPPYTYQWHRSTTLGFTPSGATAIPGATAQQLTDSPPVTGDTPVAYKVVATDSAGSPASVTYGEVVATLAKGDPIGILCIGDSRTENFGVPNYLAQAGRFVGGMATRALNKGLTSSSVAGTGSLAWADLVSGPLPAAVSAAQFEGITWANIDLGVNEDGESAATYQAGMTTVVNYLTANGFTKIVLHPPYGTSYLGQTEAANANLVAYRGALAAVAVANPGVVYVSEAGLYRHYGNFPAEIDSTGIHPMSGTGLFVGQTRWMEFSQALGLGGGGAVKVGMHGGFGG